MSSSPRSDIMWTMTPRMVSMKKIARRLGVTPSVFAEKRAELEAAGFPKPEPILQTYLLEAVDRWIDRRTGYVKPAGPGEGYQRPGDRRRANSKPRMESRRSVTIKNALTASGERRRRR